MENLTKRWNSITARRHNYVINSLSTRRINNAQLRREIITKRHESIFESDRSQQDSPGQTTIWSANELSKQE